MRFLDRFKTAEEREAYKEGYRIGQTEEVADLPISATREEVILGIAKLIGIAERLEERLEEAKRR